MEISVSEELNNFYIPGINEHNFQDEILYVSYDGNDSIYHITENTLSSEGLGEDNMKMSNSPNDNSNYVSLNTSPEFLKTSGVEDEVFDVIEPSLMSLNNLIEESDESNFNTEDVQFDCSSALLDYSDDSNTPSNNLELIDVTSQPESGSNKFKCFSVGCDKSFATSYYLSVHMKTHIIPKPFTCPVEGCNRTFASAANMKNHIKIHTGEKPHVCPTCSKAFKTSVDLSRHVRTHTGDKPFQCPIEGCHRSFSNHSVRKVHIRAHTGERPYVCNHPGCGKAFASSSNHKSHLRIHTGEKPFVCNVKGCRKRFTEYPTMYKHSISHQNQKNKILSEDFILDDSGTDQFDNL